MQKKISILIFLFLILSAFLPIFSTFSYQKIKILFKVDSNNISIFENNEEKTIEVNYPVIIKNNRSLVEAYLFLKTDFFNGSFDANFDGSQKEVTYYFSDDQENSLVIAVNYAKNTAKAYFNDEEIMMDVVPYQPTMTDQMMMASHFILPIRLIFETFGYTVEWNNETREITAYK